MKCHVPGQNAKILARAIHVLSRFGDDLFVESQPECLLLRTLNSAESAYAVIKFTKRFFSHFNHDYYTTEDDSGLKCKISMRSALNVFKSPAQLDKQVENLEIKLEPDACKLVFTLRCKHGVVKTHYVHILDCKAMQAVFTTDLIPNKIMVNQRVLTDALTNFQSSDDQLTIQVSPQTFLLRNYLDDNVDFTKLIRTQINIRPIQFDSFNISVDTQISFSLKEFRALISFAENLNLPIQINFETEGKPVVFNVHNSSTFEATFVLATQKPETDAATTQATSTTCEVNVRNKRPLSNAGDSVRKKQLVDISRNLEQDSHLFNFVDMPDENVVNCDIVNEVNEKEDSRSIPGSPNAYCKVRTLFKRCFDITMDLRSTQHVILAENSDSE